MNPITLKRQQFSRAFMKTIVECFRLIIIISMVIPQIPLGLVKAEGEADRFVSKTGSDSGDCVSSPCLTIAYAVSQSVSDDTIHIGEGVYFENLTLDKNIALLGVSLQETIIDGGELDNVITIVNPSSVSLRDLTVQNGYSDVDAGGGVANHGTVIIERVKITSNTAIHGGGIYANGPTSISDSIISENAASVTEDSRGGGINTGALEGIVSLDRVLLTGNEANKYGGAVYNHTNIQLLNVTINNNKALVGSGFFNDSYASANIMNTTIASNITYDGGSTGGVRNYSTINFKNTIISGNYPSNCYNDVEGTWNSLGNNLDSDTSCFFTEDGDIQSTDPLLGSLQDNGGLSMTMALLTGSPAIDTGSNIDCPVVDQRGVVRPFGSSCDIGAYEYQEAPGAFSKVVPAQGTTGNLLNLTLSWETSTNTENYEYCYDTSDDSVCADWTNTGTSTSVELTNLNQAVTYYWQVRAVNNFGTTFANNETWWSFTTGVLPNPFLKSNPANYVENQLLNLTLSWQTSGEVVNYEYCVDTSNNNLCDYSWIANGLNLNVAISGLTPETEYYWQVRAVNDIGNTSADIGTWWSFQTMPLPSPFSKISPQNEISNQPGSLTLNWGVSSDTTDYEYCLDTTNDNFCDGSWVNSNLDLSSSVSGLSSDTTYYWQVRAVNDVGTAYADNETWWSFTTGIPRVFSKISPVSLAINQPLNLLLTWAKSTGATSYEFCYDTNNDNFCTGTWTSNGENTSAAVSGLSQATTYYWQVRAINNFGTTYADGSSTARWSFTTGTLPGAFYLTSPEIGATNQLINPTLSWEASNLATSYQYCLDASDNDTCNSSWVSTGEALSVNLTNLDMATEYFWQVRAVNDTGITYASNANWWSFSTGSLPGALNKFSPLNGSLNQPLLLTLSWEESPGATSYEYCIDSYDVSTCNATWVNIGNNLSADLSGLYPETNYYWQVRAINPIGSIAADSETWWSFMTGSLPGEFTKVLPGDGVLDQHKDLTLSWVSSTGATTYEYCFDTTNNNACDNNWVDNGSNVDALITGLTASTSYYWQVRAKNEIGTTTSNSGSWWSFTTGVLPSPFQKTSPLNMAINQPDNLDLNWEASSAVERYEVCFDTIDNDICDGSWVDNGLNLSASITGLEKWKNYYWQVRAINEFGPVYADTNLWWTFSVLINDPLYSQQWGLEKINIESAWALTQGSSAVTIAVLDTGIDLSHSDLSSQIWVNPGEISGNGLDDDNNGFVDDVNGWNFVNGTNDVFDDNGHGTLVAGVAAAASDNGLGIAGVCPQCKIMVVKVTSASGNTNYSDMAAGVLYAAQKGAKVISISHGGYTNSTALAQAIETAVTEYDVVIVAGVGNDNLNQLYYPASYEKVLAVSGTDKNEEKATFSNYASWVDVSAPSVNILTTAMGGDWLETSGTSFSAAFASGLAGLVRSLHPDWSEALVRSHIIHTTLNTDGLNAGYSGLLGSGRIDANGLSQLPHPLLTYSGYTVNGKVNGRPLTNADSTMTISINNDWSDALDVIGTLTTTDPYVTITSDTSLFGDILAGEKVSNATAFTFTVADAAGYNHAIPFELTVSDASGYSTSFTFTVLTESNVEYKYGTITTDTTWYNYKTYEITNSVNVISGVTLTIQPGTTIKFNGAYALNIRGTLIADGTASQPIQLLSNYSGSWDKIFFDDTSVDAQTEAEGIYISGSILRHVLLDGSSAGILCTASTPFLSNITLSNGSISGSLGTTALWLTDSTISGLVNLTGPGNILRSTISGKLTLSGGGLAEDNILTAGLSFGSGSARRNVISSGGLTIGGSGGAIENNTITGNTTAGSNFNVSSNTLTGNLSMGIGSIVDHNTVSNGISVGNNSTVTWNNVENGSGTGLTAGDNITAQYNRLIGNAIGMTATTGLIEHNLIANSVGVGLRVGAATVRLNTLIGNMGNTIVVQGSNPLLIEQNNFDGNTGTYDLYVNIASGSTVTAQNNWWGTIDEAAIALRVYDYYLDDTKAIVDYSNHLIEPDATAPAFVRNVSISPDTTLGIQTGTFTVEFSQAMDKSTETSVGFFDARRGQIFVYSLEDAPINALTDSNSLVAGVDKIYVGGIRYLRNTGCVTNNTGNNPFLMEIDQVGNWKFSFPEDMGGWDNPGFYALTKDKHGIIYGVEYVATLYDGDIIYLITIDPKTNIKTRLMTVEEIGVGFISKIQFDSAGNIYIFPQIIGCGTDKVILVDSPGTVVDYSGEPISGSWWTPTIQNNVDQYGNVWSINYYPSPKGVSKYFVGYDYSLLENKKWASSTTYQSTFDFTSLIPRGGYEVGVENSVGMDGLEIVPFRGSVFTVDYLETITDQTAPLKPTVIALKDGSLTSITASWSSSDPDSPITMYRYAIGTSPGARDVVNWIYRSVTIPSVTHTGLSLTLGQKYYVSVQARNDAGLWSESGVSNEFIAGVKPSCYALTLSHRGQGSDPVAFPINSNGCEEGQYTSNEEIYFSGAVPDAEWTITGWSGTENDASILSTNRLVMPASSKTVNVNYTINTYTLNVGRTGNGSGSVTSDPVGISCGTACSYEFDYNTSVILTAVADTGSTFIGWSGGGCSGTGSCIVAMTTANSISANFWLNPGAFNKTSPLNMVDNQPDSVTLNWEITPDATSYQYCFDTSDDNMCSSWVENGTEASAALIELSPNTTYYWQVKAINDFGETYADGSSTAYWSFTTGNVPDVFNKVAPLHVATNQSLSPTLNWTASSGASSYQYCYDKSNDNACSSWVDNGSETSVALSGLTSNTEYFWQVRAINDFGTTYADGNESAIWSFTTVDMPGVFNKKTPVDDAFDQTTNVSLTWETSNNAEKYEYCIDTTDDNDCSGWTDNGTNTNKLLTGINPGNTYYWNVRAVNIHGITYANESSSSWWSFTVSNKPGYFNKISPTNSAPRQLLNPIISWTPSVGATSYQFCVSSVNPCTNWVNNGLATSKTLTGLSLGTTYYWNVRAVNSYGKSYADLSKDNWSFMTGTKPEVFNKIAPTKRSTNQALEAILSWNDSVEASSYEYCIDTTNDNKCNTGWIFTETKTSIQLSGLTRSTSYYWQVRARNTFGKTFADNGNWWVFTTTSLKPGPFSKIAPMNGATNQLTNSILSWETSLNAVNYEYCIDRINDNICTTGWQSVGIDTSITHLGLKPGKKYFWLVRARNSYGKTKSNAGVWWSFTTKP